MNVPSKRIVIPEVPPELRIHGLLPEEVAFIMEEIALRRERQWSMDEVERRCGVKRQTISDLEHWRGSASLATALKLGRGFCGDLSRFLDGSRRWLHPVILLLLRVENLPVMHGV